MSPARSLKILARVLAPATALAALLVLAACSGLPGNGPAPDIYTLSPKSTFEAQAPRVDSQLALAMPTTSRALDTDRIALRPEPLEYRYYKGVRWTGHLPAMVQTLLLESFENTGLITAVGRDSSILRADYLLLADIREFQIDDFGPSAPRANVRIVLKLVRQPASRIVDSRSFEAEVPFTRNGMTGIVGGFDQALGKVLKKGVPWALENIAQDAAAR
ncbi:protein of unknown function DUF330 [Desulfovibrio sp. X2]|uniref:ABC-type transport auxiliary lipoprotein family protein n=1 Tax=Desulfovibrio sp. X2 TaxID=941449 RepID=UPI0003587DB8|nr:ABC-type transport auxiliary lipoprotein family protein [Desulfovibrio sp. X2]EPR44691.1 protein of unknown function DUF330 [Desulfovibrio sp. X2]